MDKKEQKKIMVLTLPLNVEPWQYDRLNKKMEVARTIYNTMLHKQWNRYQEMVNRKDWKATTEVIRAEHQKAEGTPGGKKKGKKTPELVAAYDARNQLTKDYGFSEYDFMKEALCYASHYSAVIPSTMASLSIGSRMWTAFEKVLYGTGDKVSFRRRNEFNSLKTDGKSGMRLIRDEQGKPYILLSNRMAKAKQMKLYFDEPEDLYGKTLYNSPVKQITLVRRQEKTKWHYYVQLSVDVSGCPDDVLNHSHPVNYGKVGLAIWRGDLYAVSESCVKHFSLNPWRESFEEERDELNRQIEALRRQNNPDNYNADGTIKKGKLSWHHSRRYLDLVRYKRELERKNKERRNIHHRHIVYELLEMGDEFVMYDFYFRTEKEEFDEENKKTNAEYRKAKERRKSIQENAPSELLTLLSQKLKQNQRPEITKCPIPKELYWYQHVEDISDKDLMPHRTIFVGGERLPQTAYRAFLMLGYMNDDKIFDKEYLDSIWPAFLFHMNDIEQK